MPYSLTEIQQKIIAEARRQGVDPALALGIAKAESSFNPNSVGDRGKAIGLFQLQPAAASDVGLRPEERYDVDKNIAGGIAYLRNRQRREGDEDRGISAYNQGVGVRGGQLSNPQYVRTVRQYQRELQPVVAGAKPGLLKRVMGAMTPASAEAATLSDIPDLPARPTTSAPGAGTAVSLSDIPDLPARPAAPGSPGATAPPPAAETFPPLAEQEAAAQQQALSGVSPREAYDVDVQSGPPGTFRGAPSPLETPEATMRPIPQPQGPPPPPSVSAQRLRDIVVPPEAPREPLTAQRALGLEAGGPMRTAAGIAIPTMTTALGALLGVPGMIVGSYLGRQANIKLGLEQPGPGGDVLSVVVPALSAVWSGAKAVGRGIARGSRAGKAVTAADEATTAAQKAYQESLETAEQQYAREQAEMMARTRAQEAERLQKVQQRRIVAEEKHAAQEARRQPLVEQRQRQARETAETATQTQAREYAEQQARYDQAVASQTSGVAQARAIPGRYTPETPAHVLYKKVAEIAPEAPVTLGRTQEVAAELQDVLQQVPSLQPSRLQSLLTDVRAARSTQSVREVQRYLSDLGLLTRSPDSATRRTAKQLYGALHDDLAESATRLPETEAARDLLLQANATFRRELAARDLGRVIRRGITVGDDGVVRVAPGRIRTNVERLIEEDRFFAGSFSPEELTQLRGELERLSTVQKVPTRPGAQPPPVTPKAVEPYTPKPFQEPTIPAGERVVPQTTAEMARIPQRPTPGPPPEPVAPTLTPREHGAFRTLLRTVGLGEAALTGGLGPFSKVALGAEAKDKMADLLANMMLRPQWQPYLRAVMNADGTINRKAIIVLAGGRAALQAERKQQ